MRCVLKSWFVTGFMKNRWGESKTVCEGRKYLINSEMQSVKWRKAKWNTSGTSVLKIGTLNNWILSSTSQQVEKMGLGKEKNLKSFKYYFYVTNVYRCQVTSITGRHMPTTMQLWGLYKYVEICVNVTSFHWS